MLKGLLVGLMLALSVSVHAESLSYSGRLVNGNGSPVSGTPDLKFELAYSGTPGTIKCTEDVLNVPLTNGVFHAKLDFDCSLSSKTLNEILTQVPVGQTVVIRVTNVDASKVYSFQELHSLPLAKVSEVAKQLDQNSATSGQILSWDGTKWVPINPPSGGGGGSVTSITANSGLSGGTITSTGTIGIAAGGVTDSHLASGISRAKIAGGIPNYVVMNDASGNLTQVAQLPVAQGGTGSGTATGARTNLGLGTAATVNLGYASGNALPADNIPVCLAGFKLQFTGIGPLYWGCASDDSIDSSKLPLTGGTMSGPINMGGQIISNLATPTNDAEAATKKYVDDKIVAAPSLWTISGVNIFNSNSGNVGVGTNTPTEKLDVSGNVAVTGNLQLKSDNANFVTLRAPTSLGATFNYTLPLTAPTAGQVLSSSAAGVMTWITPSAGGVTTAFGRSGAVTATAGDYSGALITNTPAGTISSSTVQAAIDELATEKQAADATLTSLAAYNTNGIVVQTGADTFTGRSIAGVANRTVVTNGNGVSGDPAVDINTTLLPSPAAPDAGKFLKATGLNAASWNDLVSADVTTALGFTPINKAGDTITSGTTSFAGTSVLQVGNAPVNLNDVPNKQYVDNLVAGGANQWTQASANIYRASGNVGIGTSTPVEALDISRSDASPRVRAINTSSTSVRYPGFVAVNYAANTLGFSALDLVNSRGSQASPAPMQTGDALGAVTAMGNTATGSSALTNAAQIMFTAAGNYTATSSPSNIIFRTTPAGSIANANRMIINSEGDVGIGTVAPTTRFEVQKPFNSLMNVTAAFIGGTDTSIANTGIYVVQKDNAGLGTNNSKLLNVVFNDVSRMVVTGAGNVGIGTTTPGWLLTLGSGANGDKLLKVTESAAGNKRASVMLGQWEVGQDAAPNNTRDFFIYDGVNGQQRFHINTAGNVGIGVVNSVYKLDVAGQINATGLSINPFPSSGMNNAVCYNSTWGILGYCTSLSSTKRDIKDLKLGLDNLLKLRPVTFRWKDGGSMKDLGFIAEEVKKVDPILADHDNNGKLIGVRYNQMTSLIVKAMQELYTKFSNQLSNHEKKFLEQDRKIASISAENAKKEQEIAKLRKQNDELKSRLDRIEKQLSRQK